MVPKISAPPSLPYSPVQISLRRLLQDIWRGRPTVDGDSAAAQCVIAFAFGRIERRTSIEPGPSNTALARLARELFPDLPKILQGEIADAYQPGLYSDRAFRIDRHRRPGSYLDTYEAAVQASEIMQHHGWHTAALLAHAHHAPRSAAVCRRLGIRIIIPPGLDAVPFCPASSQPWTRNRPRWLRRELGAALWYRLTGRL